MHFLITLELFYLFLTFLFTEGTIASIHQVTTRLKVREKSKLIGIITQLYLKQIFKHYRNCMC